MEKKKKTSSKKTIKEDVVKKEKNKNKEESINVEPQKKRINNTTILGIICIIMVVLLSVTLFKNESSASEEIQVTLKEDDALSIGENKYLEFLWIVDDAFNDARFNSKISVNNKVMNDANKKFVCNYENDDKRCHGLNFPEAFSDIFASNLTYNDVYGDGLAFSWYEKKNDEYYFKNMNACNSERMSTKQTLELVEKTDNKLTFKVTYVDDIKAGIYKGIHDVSREFILVKEDNNWKVSKAYYHDPCFMDYYIPRG